MADRILVDGIEVGSLDDAASHLQRNGLGGLAGVMRELLGRPARREVCPHCGTTQTELVEAGLAGCPLCYVVFSNLIETRFPAGNG